jgi:hypothetical protein
METTIEVINGKNRTVATFEIPFNGKQESIKIKKLNYGELNDLQRSCTKLQVLGGTTKFEVDRVAMDENSIVKSILSAPFNVTLDEIRNLEPEQASIILTNITELNQPSDKKKEN